MRRYVYKSEVGGVERSRATIEIAVKGLMTETPVLISNCRAEINQGS
jgi:hypothetical protein